MKRTPLDKHVKEFLNIVVNLLRNSALVGKLLYAKSEAKEGRILLL
jgi:hypothetical protein